MEFIENHRTEFKSLKKVLGGKSDVESLAETCVAFANAQGGVVIVSIENNENEPPPQQVVDNDDVNKVISRLRS